MRHVILLKFFPHHTCERIHLRLVDVQYLEQCRIEFVRRPHARDDRYTACAAPARQINLCRHRIHRIHDIIITLRKKIIRILRQIKRLYPCHLAVRGDTVNAHRHCFDLRHPNGIRTCVDLPVDIRHIDAVVVNECQMPNTRTGKSLGGKRTEAANTKHSDGGAGKPRHTGHAEQHLSPHKAAAHIHRPLPFSPKIPAYTTKGAAANIRRSSPTEIYKIYLTTSTGHFACSTTY